MNDYVAQLLVAMTEELKTDRDEAVIIDKYAVAISAYIAGLFDANK